MSVPVVAGTGGLLVGSGSSGGESRPQVDGGESGEIAHPPSAPPRADAAPRAPLNPPGIQDGHNVYDLTPPTNKFVVSANLLFLILGIRHTNTTPCGPENTSAGIQGVARATKAQFPSLVFPHLSLALGDTLISNEALRAAPSTCVGQRVEAPLLL